MSKKKRASTAPASVQISIRLPPDLLDRLDRHVARMQAEHPALAVSRADGVRVLLSEGLDRAERSKRRK